MPTRLSIGTIERDPPLDDSLSFSEIGTWRIGVRNSGTPSEVVVDFTVLAPITGSDSSLELMQTQLIPSIDATTPAFAEFSVAMAIDEPGEVGFRVLARPQNPAATGGRSVRDEFRIFFVG